MIQSYFAKREPIEEDVVIDYNGIVNTVTSTLNKIAEARFDGNNAQYVGNMQPEMDFCQDSTLVGEFFADGMANIVRKLEPYVKEWDDGMMGDRILSLVFPCNWKRNQLPVLENKIRKYLVNYIVAEWLEKVSMSDTAYTMEKAAQLLRDIKGVCELRHGKVHRGFDTTY